MDIITQVVTQLDINSSASETLSVLAREDIRYIIIIVDIKNITLTPKHEGRGQPSNNITEYKNAGNMISLYPKLSPAAFLKMLLTGDN